MDSLARPNAVERTPPPKSTNLHRHTLDGGEWRMEEWRVGRKKKPEPSVWLAASQPHDFLPFGPRPTMVKLYYYSWSRVIRTYCVHTIRDSANPKKSSSFAHAKLYALAPRRRRRCCCDVVLSRLFTMCLMSACACACAHHHVCAIGLCMPTNQTNSQASPSFFFPI